MNIQCIRCKGKGFCGRKYCPHILKSQSMFKIAGQIKKSEINSQSPTPFIGRFGYPFVNVGILAPQNISKDIWKYDAPKYWSKNNLQIPEIVDFRSSLINSRKKFNISNNKQNRLLDIGKEIGMASKPVDIEINLKDKPKFRLNPNSITAPMGPNAQLKKAKITSNSKIHTKVEKVVNDIDLKSVNALNYLYQNNFDENFLSKILSIGNLGIKKKRKLVPTRWSITAVDDTLGKEIHKKIIYSQTINDYSVFFGDYLGNFYLILMIPDIWSYELFETYMPKSSWNTQNKINYTTDYETYKGRKTYAHECAGGYYTVKLALLEKLQKIKKQSSCLVIRIITGDYSLPLGVWVTREAARKALQNKPLNFSSLELMLKYTKALIKKKFGFDAEQILNKSKLLKTFQTQSKLNKFF